VMLQLNTRARDRAFDLLGEKNARKAETRALNRSIASAKTLAVKVVRQDMGLKAGTVRDRIFAMKATPSKPLARLSATNARIPLIEFNAKGPEPSRGRGNGVRAKLPAPGKGRYPHAFIATMPNSGHRGVFQRDPKRSMKTPGVAYFHRTKTMDRRQAIYELKGPSVAQSFTRNAPAIEARAEEVLQTNFDHEVQYLASQATQ